MGILFKKYGKKNIIFNNEIKNYVENLINEIKNITIPKIQKNICNNFDNLKIDRETLRKYLKNGLKLNWKRNAQYDGRTNCPNVEIRRKEFVTKMYNCVQEKRIEIYIDETGCSIELQPVYSWYFRNKKNIIPQNNKMRYIRLHVCCAISPQLGLVGLQILEKSWRKNDYNGFFYNMLKENEFPLYKKNKFVIVHDNASWHKSIEKIFEKYFDNDLIILPNAPYSPDLNPIEEFFGCLKNKLRYFESKNIEELIKNIIELAYCIKKSTIIKYVENSKSKWPEVLNFYTIN